MSGDYQVSSSGTVNMKYLNDLTVGGLTATQAQAAIQSLLEDQEFYTRDAIRIEVTLLARTGAPPASGALPMGPQAEQRGAAGEKEALDALRSLLAADRGTHKQLTAQQSEIRTQLGVQRANTARVREMAAKGLATADAVLRAEQQEAALARTVMLLEQQLTAVQARIATYQGTIDSLVGSGPALDQKTPVQVKPGETIAINVEGRPELSGEYVVQADGTIKLKGVQSEFIEVQVRGAVRSPGVIRMQGGDRRVMRAIAQAGGFTANAGNEVEIIRRGPGRGLSGLRVTRAQLDANEDPGLQDGDRVTVKVGQVFFVNGEVKSQGEKKWSRGMTVAKALELAGGPTVSFSLDRARIERPVKDKDGAVLRYEKIANLKMETVILPDDVLVAGRTPE
jgi:protein involved in polysaccharide export with SLBB domain